METSAPAPRIGSLAVSSEVWGRVTIDDVEAGTTDLQAQVDAGEHRVVVKVSNGGPTLSATAVVQQGKKTKCRVEGEALRCRAPQ